MDQWNINLLTKYTFRCNVKIAPQREKGSIQKIVWYGIRRDNRTHSAVTDFAREAC